MRSDAFIAKADVVLCQVFSTFQEVHTNRCTHALQLELLVLTSLRQEDTIAAKRMAAEVIAQLASSSLRGVQKTSAMSLSFILTMQF